MIKKSSGLMVLLVLIVLSNINQASAQVKQTHRFEKEYKGRDGEFNIITLNEDGVALLRDKDKYSGNKKIWEVILLDTALNEKHTIEFEVEHRYPLVGYEVGDDHLYLLYRTGETTKNSLQLVDLDIEEGVEVKQYEIKPELDFKLTHFSKVGSSMVLGGYVTNEPAVLLYDMQNNSIKIVPGFFQKDTELVDLRVNENQTFNTLLLDRSLRAERKLIFKTFDETGKLLLDDIVAVDDDKSLQTSISSTLKRDDLLVLGTWGDKQGKQANGFFSLAVDPFREQKINYIHLGELERYLDYLKPKRAQRIKENTREDLKTGKSPSFVNYVMPYRIEEHPEGFLLVAEVYQPSSNVNPYYRSPYSNPYYNNPYLQNPFWPGYYPGMRMYRSYPYGQNVRNSEEIKTHATVVLSFDAQGKLLWDQSIKLDEIKKPALEQVADYCFNGSLLTFLYKKESDLKVKQINTIDGAVTEVEEKVKLSEDRDEIRSERNYDGGVKQWTENSFYVWGYQTIRNPQHKGNKTRDVFYVNKVVVE